MKRKFTNSELIMLSQRIPALGNDISNFTTRLKFLRFQDEVELEGKRISKLIEAPEKVTEYYQKREEVYKKFCETKEGNVLYFDSEGNTANSRTGEAKALEGKELEYQNARESLYIKYKKDIDAYQKVLDDYNKTLNQDSEFTTKHRFKTTDFKSKRDNFLDLILLKPILEDL